MQKPPANVVEVLFIFELRKITYDAIEKIIPIYLFINYLFFLKKKSLHKFLSYYEMNNYLFCKDMSPYKLRTPNYQFNYIFIFEKTSFITRII